MSRFGKKRVPECRCTSNFTCGPCLNASVLTVPAVHTREVVIGADRHSEPTTHNQLWHARRMPTSELTGHALVSLSNRHRCDPSKEELCFCCAALTVLEERNPQLVTDTEKAERILDAMEGN